MPDSTSFPVFFKMEFDPGNAFAAFTTQAGAAGRSAGEQMQRQFQASASELSRIASEALSSPRTSGGGLDLGVGPMRQATQAAEQRAVALREVAAAASALAATEARLTAAQQAVIAGAHAAAAAAEQDAVTERERLAVYEQLQAQLGRSATGFTALGHASGNTRVAQMELGHVVRASVDQFAAGAPPIQIFSQHLAQLSQAATYAGESMGAFGTFMGGPWGIALTAGISILGALSASYLGNAGATHTADDATRDLISAIRELGTATSQEIQSSQQAERQAYDHARALRTQAIDARTAAVALLEVARARIQGAQESEVNPQLAQEGGFNAGSESVALYAGQIARLTARINELNGSIGTARSAVRSLATPILQRRVDEQLDASAHATGSYERAIDSLNGRLAAGTITNSQYTASLRAETVERDRAIAAANRHERRPREDHRPEQAGAAIEQITRLNAEWDSQPALVDKAEEAIRRVNHILAEAGAHNFPRFQEMQRDAEQAERSIRQGLLRQIVAGFSEAPKLVQRASEAMNELAAAGQRFPELGPRIQEAGRAVIDAVLRPYREYLGDQVRAYETQSLIGQGRLEEADALGIIHRLEQQMGPLSEERKQTILASVAGLRAQAEAMAIIQQRQAAYTTAAAGVRSSIENLLANPQSGLRGLSSLVSTVSGTFNRLNAQVLTERLFGGIFRQMDDLATGRTRLKQSNEALATSMDATRATNAALGAAQGEMIPAVEALTAKLESFGSAITTATTAMQGHTGAGAGTTTLGTWDASGSGPGWRGGAPTGRLPVRGTITNTYAQHVARGSHGLDIAAALGTPVVAPAAGEVLVIGQDSRSGIFVKLGHGAGQVTSYAHLSRVNVTQGQQVGAGDVLGAVGQTGHATGPHLHYRVRVNDRDVDPATFRFAEQAAAAQGSVERLGTGLADLTPILASLTDGAGPAAQGLADVGKAIKDALDEADSILVTGPRPGQRGRAANNNSPPQTPDKSKEQTPQDSTAQLSPHDFVAQLLGQVAGRMFGGEEGAVKMGKVVGKALADYLEGSAYGQFGAQAVLGRSNAGSSIGGALGDVAGKALGGSFKKILGNFGGNFAGPIGSLAGGILGTVIGGLFSKTPHASSTITLGPGGNLVTSTTGSKSLQGQTSAAADSITATVNRIAELFGGSFLSGSGSVSVSERKNKFYVDPKGRGATSTKNGAIEFDNAADAIRAATLDLIRDGVIAGLRQSTQRLLQSAKDLDTGIQKALDFEGVFTDLKKRLDPVGAAIDEVDKHFAHLKTIFAEAGASAEEYAQLEQLYALDRADAIKQAGEQMTSTLKSLIADLTVNNDARALRERLSLAHAQYDPLAARVAAGDKTVDYDAFATAARLVEQLTRQINGSTQPYFETLDQITKLATGALAGQQATIDVATAKDPLFAPASPAGDSTVSAIDRLGGYLGGILSDQLGGELRALNDNAASMIGLLAGMSGTGGGGQGFSRVNNF